MICSITIFTIKSLTQKNKQTNKQTKKQTKTAEYATNYAIYEKP